MQTSDFDYHLPPESIAQTPVEPRDAARLMVVDRATGQLTHSHFYDLPRWLRAGDVLVFNNTRVIPARVLVRRADTGGKGEILLLRQRSPLAWEVLIGGKGNRVGQLLKIEGHARLEAIVMQEYPGARRLVQFSQPITPLLEKIGHIPLPPYIHAELTERERYQTVYSQIPGSAAAPTAGLHFTPTLLEKLRAQGVQLEQVTLHVGLDTFQPVSEADPTTHTMHGEWCELLPETAARINAAKREGRRIITVGTTAVRVLESAAAQVASLAPHPDWVAPLSDTTSLFILPGYKFRVVDGMITNFHLPKSTLLMLVAAFAGRELVLQAYELAKRENYRFFSFGDATLLI